LNLKTALYLLPLCKWGDLSGKELQEQRQTIAAGLNLQAAEYKQAWQNWIASDREDGTTTRIGYGTGYDYWY
jgi:hypothetical protein